jgi:hypothetical protein
VNKLRHSAGNQFFQRFPVQKLEAGHHAHSVVFALRVTNSRFDNQMILFTDKSPAKRSDIRGQIGCKRGQIVEYPRAFSVVWSLNIPGGYSTFENIIYFYSSRDEPVQKDVNICLGWVILQDSPLVQRPNVPASGVHQALVGIDAGLGPGMASHDRG